MLADASLGHVNGGLEQLLPLTSKVDHPPMVEPDQGDRSVLESMDVERFPSG